MDIYFHQYLNESNIICGLLSETGSGAIEELSSKLYPSSFLVSRKDIYNAVIARENILSTVVMPGLAVPHARIKGIKSVHVALGISEKGVDFRHPKMSPVNVVAMILSPDSDPSLHFRILYAIAHEFKKPGITEKLKTLKTASEVITLFQEYSA